MSHENTATPVLTYEQQLRGDWNWNMEEADRHFQEDNAVYKTLHKITRRLDELALSYAVAGGMALNAHGVRRLTVDVDILVTRDNLTIIHNRLEGLGWVPPFTGSKQLRDTEHGVRVEFLVTGEFPGDGKPKPVAFPDPSTVGVDIGGVRYLSLSSLIELKLASGMTGGLHRLKDLADVVALITTLELSADFADTLNPFVREKYIEIWQGLQDGTGEI